MKKTTITAMIAILVIFSSFQTRFLPTSLRITVIDNLGNFVENAEVTIYTSEEDYRNGTNPVSEKQMTDDKGRVKFKDLEPKSYFIDARKGDQNNDGEGVKTAVLKEGRMNKVNTVIE
ncbi:MAG: carboxypeptidase regulatory-like domain-containing protein [Cyclobacteriaceae bacterium]